jgi:hypothetical protein
MPPLVVLLEEQSTLDPSLDTADVRQLERERFNERIVSAGGDSFVENPSID